jgi:hypothetical protein
MSERRPPVTQAPEPPAQQYKALDRNAGGFGCAVDGAVVVERLLEAHRRQAYRDGYRQATADLRAMLVWIAEEALRRHGGAGDSAAQTRKTVYAFVEELERRVERLPHSPFVEGGLGI